LTIPIIPFAPAQSCDGYAVFALIVDPSFFKLKKSPALRDRDRISVHHRGGTTMRTWTKLLPAVLLILPITGSSFAADAAPSSKDIEQLKTDVKELRESVQKLEAAMRLNELRGARIEEHYLEIIRRLDRVTQQQQTIERIAAYGPPVMPGAAIPGAPVPPTTGTVILENRHPSPAQVRINGQPYTVGGFQTIQVPRVPAGPFEYSVEVDGLLVSPPHTETLPPTGYRIRIYPR
jgi:hypothetical protein